MHTEDWHPVGEPCDFVTGEDRLRERDIRELAEHWRLTDPQPPNALVILEVSHDDIVLADALKTKALVPTERIRVDWWPDIDQRLVPWSTRAN